MNIIKDKIVYVLVVVLFITIPIVLNWLLQLNCPLDNVISNNNSGPGVWLAFWGAYLSACGSFAMAWVAYNQNKKTLIQNNLFYKITAKERECDSLENIIVENEKIHSFSMSMEISEYCFLGKYADASKQLTLCEENIQTAALRMPRLSQNPDCKPYGDTIAAINQICCDLLCIMHEIINYAENGTAEKITNHDFRQYLLIKKVNIGESDKEKKDVIGAFVEYAWGKYHIVEKESGNTLYYNFRQKGLDLLLQEREKAVKLAKKQL